MDQIGVNMALEIIIICDNPTHYCFLIFFLLVFKVRVVLKYRHCDGNLCIKVTDDSVVSHILRID